MLYQFDPAKVHLCIIGVPIVIPRVSGYADGTSIRVAPAGPRFVRHDGIRGQVVRVRQTGRAGSVVFVLEERAPANSLLQAIATTDDALQSGIVALAMVDEHGLDLAFCPQAWIVGSPEWQKGAGPGTKTWAFDCGRLEILSGTGIPTSVNAADFAASFVGV